MLCVELCVVVATMTSLFCFIGGLLPRRSREWSACHLERWGLCELGGVGLDALQHWRQRHQMGGNRLY